MPIRLSGHGIQAPTARQREGSQLRSTVRRALGWLGHVLPYALRRGVVLGSCPICQGPTLFFKEGTWLRDQFRCVRCGSIPRWRALIAVLEDFFPQWRELVVHESSPSGSASKKLARECKQYTPTHWFPDTSAGQSMNGFRCENLENQTFPEGSFDLVITQDVFEHILDPAKGFREVARTLKAGGAHVFTIPWYYWQETLVRAVREADGSVRHLVEPDYHANPLDPKGSLVVTEWGADFCDFIYRHSGLTTTAVRMLDRHRGIEARFIEVFISQKQQLDDEEQHAHRPHEPLEPSSRGR